MILAETSVKRAMQIDYSGELYDENDALIGITFEASVGGEEITLPVHEWAELGEPKTMWLYLGTGQTMWT